MGLPLCEPPPPQPPCPALLQERSKEDRATNTYRKPHQMLRVMITSILTDARALTQYSSPTICSYALWAVFPNSWRIRTTKLSLCNLDPTSHLLQSKGNGVLTPSWMMLMQSIKSSLKSKRSHLQGIRGGVKECALSGMVLNNNLQ